MVNIVNNLTICFLFYKENSVDLRQDLKNVSTSDNNSIFFFSNIISMYFTQVFKKLNQIIHF